MMMKPPANQQAAKCHQKPGASLNSDDIFKWKTKFGPIVKLQMLDQLPRFRSLSNCQTSKVGPITKLQKLDQWPTFKSWTNCKASKAGPNLRLLKLDQLPGFTSRTHCQASLTGSERGGWHYGQQKPHRPNHWPVRIH